MPCFARCRCVLLTVAAAAALARTGAAQPVTIVPVGTTVRVKLLQFISSETSQPGEIVRFEVFQDVLLNGTVVISRRTPAIGSIIWAKAYRPSAPFWSLRLVSRGQLFFTISETTFVNGEAVRLEGPIVGPNKQRPRPLIIWHHDGEVFDAVVD